MMWLTVSEHSDLGVFALSFWICWRQESPRHHAGQDGERRTRDNIHSRAHPVTCVLQIGPPSPFPQPPEIAQVGDKVFTI